MPKHPGHLAGPIVGLIDVMATLRTPDVGCPWDLEQTFQTIASYTIEEAYEVADAIARDEMCDLKDELGDLLLQVIYHARMAEERGSFTFADVVEAILQKMVRRHPHVFGSAEARAAGPAEGFWQAAKAEERRVKAAARTESGHSAERQSLLDDIPIGLPALSRAVKLQNKAARAGFDWPSFIPVLEKMKEELGELEAAIREGEQAKIAEEYGDLLFVLANVARHLAIDPESSLRGTNEKFRRRFRRIEEKLADMGKTPAQSDLAEMDALWDEAKLEERAQASRPSHR